MVSNEKSPGGLSGCGNSEPVETWMASAPSLSHHFATSMVSASTLPFFSQGMTLLRSTALSLTCRWKSRPTRGADRPDHLEQEARAILQRAAVLVGAVVDAGREELREQVAVGGMQLDAVEAGLARAPGAAGERLDELLDLGLARRRGRESRAATPCGWSSSSDGRCGIVHARHVHLPARMAELHDVLAVEPVHRLAEPLPQRDEIVAVHGGVAAR